MIDPKELQEKVLETIMEEMDEFDHEEKFGGIEVEISIPEDMIDPDALKDMKKDAKKSKKKDDEEEDE